MRAPNVRNVGTLRAGPFIVYNVTLTDIDYSLTLLFARALKGPDGELPTFDTLGALMHPYRLAMRSPLYQC